MKIWSFVAVGIAAVATFFAPPAQSFQDPQLARIIFFHLPCAILSAVCLALGAFFALRFLLSRNSGFDIRSSAVLEMGGLLAILTMLTGILFSKVQWGTWWQWDPRQTSYLIVTLLYGGYFALRSSLHSEYRALYCSVYSLMTVLPALFLIFVFPRLPQIQQVSFHPSTTIQEGQLDSFYRLILYFCFAAIAFACTALVVDRVKVAQIRINSKGGILELDSDSGGAAGTRTAGPVAIRNED